MKTARTVFYAGLVALMAGALGLAWPDLLARAAYAVERGQASGARERLTFARELSSAFQDVARAVRPSVVSIRSVQRIEAQQALPPIFGRSPFGDEFLERFFGRSVPRDQPQEFVRRGQGTGVIISPEGYVVTNNHVIRDASEITVLLSDKRSFTAKVVGADEKSDLAVLKIETRDLFPAELGDSDELEVGEWVLAIGNPFGLEQTVTAGIVSATGRARVGIADYEDFIQTDAAINPGNSGGPLVSLDGKVIGINTAIATRTGGYQGIGFAIPSNMVRQIARSIVEDGRVVRGWLGVAIQDLTDGLARSFGYEGKGGVLIGDVTAGSPAEAAGLRPGDIITSFDGREVSDMNQLRNQVAAIRPGTEVRVQLVREGKPKTLSVRIGELESPDAAASAAPAQAGDVGLTVRTLTPELASRIGARSGDRGVVVTAVQPASPAEKAGLQAGDLIIAVGDRDVASETEFREALAAHDLSQGVRLRVQSGGVLRFVLLAK